MVSAAVAPSPTPCLHLALEHGDLVAHDENLGVLGAVGAGEQGEPGKHAEHRLISEP